MRRYDKGAVKSAVTLSRVIADLTGQQLRQHGRELVAICPFHDDTSPSLRIDDGKDGGVWHCDPCAKGGDVFKFVRQFNTCSFPEALSFLGERYGAEADSELGPTQPRSSSPSGSWIYHRPDGSEAFRVERFEEENEKKTFRQSAPDGRGGWICKRGCMDGVERWLYRVDHLRGHETVCLVEGEGVADALCSLRIPATTAPGGAGNWHTSNPTRSPIGLGGYAEQFVDASNKNVAILPDNDDPGRRYSEAAARACHAAELGVKVITLPGLPPGGDVVDFLAAGGTKADLLKAIANAPRHEPATTLVPADRSEREPGAGPPDVETTLAQCDLADIPTPPSAANMAKLEESLRRLRTALEAADPLRIAAVRGALVVKCQAAKVPSPAALIDSALAPLKKAASEQTTNDLELFPIDEPWPDPVDGVELMSEVRDLLHQYLVLPPHVDAVVPLWAQHTYLMDCWDISPFLTTTSPAPECGKSTLAAIVGGVSHHTVNSSNATAAAIFRLIDKYGPTLILDEADTWFGLRDELRGILNSGHKRSGARVIRADGENNEPKVFSTWAPKLIAMIGTPVPTISSRSILVPMRRKTEKERRPRLKDRVLQATCQRLRRKCLRWALDHRKRLMTAEPAISELLENRTGDNWLPLFAIADEIGEPWAIDVRTAAKKLSSVSQDQEHGIVLLADIKSIWESDKNQQEDFLKTSVILKSLHEMEARPWGAWGKQEKPMTPQVLARLLKPYDPKPTNKRVGSTVLKGYMRSDFEDAWLRYLSTPPVPAATPLQVNKNGGKPDNPVRYTSPDVADEQTDVSPIKTGKNGKCSGVAAGKPGPGEKNEKLLPDEGVAVENQGGPRFRDF